MRSLDFAIDSAFRKLYCVKSKEILIDRRSMSGCPPMSYDIENRKCNFFRKYANSTNFFCTLFAHVAVDELKVQ